LAVPATLEVKGWAVPGANIALGGEMLTMTCGKIVTALLAERVASA
jgi:hypothetical protein